MTEMRTTTGADNLRSFSIRIRNPFDSSSDLIVEAGPSTVRIELVLCAIQRRITASAYIGSLFPEIIVLAAERRLGTFLNDDSFLFLG